MQLDAWLAADCLVGVNEKRPKTMIFLKNHDAEKPLRYALGTAMNNWILIIHPVSLEDNIIEMNYGERYWSPKNFSIL